MKPEKCVQSGEKRESRKTSGTSIISLHGEIQDVINTMGPSTPVNVEVDSGDEATISSRNSSQNSHATNGTSNTSFVEVVIRNHHRKCKIIRENIQPTLAKPCYASVQIQTENDDPIQESVYSFDKSAKEFKIDFNEADKPSVQDTSIKTTVLPQRYFKVNASTKKQGTVIDLMPSESKPKLNEFAQDVYSVKRNEKRIFLQNESILKSFNDENYQGKTELYYFDRGNFAFYNTTDYPPIIMADHLAEKTEITAVRFWAETFGMANVILAFITTFILQLLRFGLFGIVRPMTAGVIQLTSDYFIKPLLASIFNGIVQPPLIFLFNILSSVRDVCEPIAQTLGFFTREIAVIFKAFRLVDVKKNDQVPV